MGVTTHEIIGKPIISMADGVKIGDAKDLLLNVTTLQIVAVLVAEEKGRFDLPWAKIKSVGPDAITVEDRTVLEVASKPVEPIREYHEFNGMNVVDGSGSIVGTVHELTLDEAGKIRSIETKAGGVFGIGAKGSIVAVEEIRGVGPRLVTIERTPPST